MKTELKIRSKRYISKLKLWDEIIRDWQNSGMNQKRYCQAKQLCYSTFKRWRGELKIDKLIGDSLQPKIHHASHDFIPVRIAEPLPSKAMIINSELLIKTKQGHEIKVCSDFDEKIMVKLLKSFRLAEVD